VNGREMHDLITTLYPLCRSITGPGLRRTFELIADHLELELTEIPTGTAVLDWTVPPEWTIREAWIKDPSGRRVVDFAESNLHVVSYSAPVRARLSLAKLRPHLYSLPDHPDWVPYRTSYYEEYWGFCLAHRVLEELPDGEYEVCIDSELSAGALTLAEHVLPGESDGEVLFSCHACHPSLANDNLSSLAVAVALARRLAGATRRYTYRFLFTPGTIGSIAWLARNRHEVDRLRHGLVLACLGDRGILTYKASRRGNARIDRVARRTLARSGRPHRVRPFSPYGYDERQYCSPGFDLPVGSLTRTPHGEYPEYHTSADDLAFVDPGSLEDSLEACWDIVEALEADRCYRNLAPYGEPQLGRRGLYQAIGGRSDRQARQMAMLWVLNLSDGDASLDDVAERSGVDVTLLTDVAQELQEAGLLVGV
jgi:aminopeptidase-like protein